MDKAITSVIAAAAALVLSGGAYAQANNTLATPSTRSPAAVSPDNSTSGYGTPGAINSESGTGVGSGNVGTPNAGLRNSMNDSSTPDVANGVNNTLARPSVKSPVQ
ncbi:hypothetical protein [Trinickia sp.]|uniref:hypothetical protein n=1 Tax=Trinickia sp. TaxID=2571163 RepID=UPI003F7D9FA0